MLSNLFSLLYMLMNAAIWILSYDLIELEGGYFLIYGRSKMDFSHMEIIVGTSN